MMATIPPPPWETETVPPPPWEARVERPTTGSIRSLEPHRSIASEGERAFAEARREPKEEPLDEEGRKRVSEILDRYPNLPGGASEARRMYREASRQVDDSTDYETALGRVVGEKTALREREFAEDVPLAEGFLRMFRKKFVEVSPYKFATPETVEELHFTPPASGVGGFLGSVAGSVAPSAPFMLAGGAASGAARAGAALAPGATQATIQAAGQSAARGLGVPAVSIFAADAAKKSLAESAERGDSFGKAVAAALGRAISEAVPEFLGFQVIGKLGGQAVEEIGKLVLRGETKAATKILGNASGIAATGALEESVTLASGELSDALIGVKPMGEAVETIRQGLPMTAAAGATGGLMLGGAAMGRVSTAEAATSETVAPEPTPIVPQAEVTSQPPQEQPDVVQQEETQVQEEAPPEAEAEAVPPPVRPVVGPVEREGDVRRPDVVESGGVAKQPWEMTRDDFDKEYVFTGVRGTGELEGGKTRAGTYFGSHERAAVYADLSGRGGGKVYAVRRSDVVPMKGEDGVSQHDIDVGHSVRSGREHEAIEVDKTDFVRAHRSLVERALRQGLPVPPEVLADYPDLAPPARSEPAGSERLYRETDVRNAAAFLDPTVMAGESEMYFSDDPAIAIGQGENRGVLIELASEGLSRTERTKPGTGIVGGREYAMTADPANLRDRVAAVTIKKGPQSDAAYLRRVKSSLQRLGWEAVKTDEGTRYENPAFASARIAESVSTTEKQPWEITRGEYVDWADRDIRAAQEQQKPASGFRGPVDKLWTRKKAQRVMEKLESGGWVVSDPDEAVTTESIYFTAKSPDGRVAMFRISGHGATGVRQSRGLRSTGGMIHIARTTNVEKVAEAAEKRAFRQKTPDESFGPDHRRIVESSLREGKPVPPEVLKDYPDLAEQAPKPSPDEPTEPPTITRGEREESPPSRPNPIQRRAFVDISGITAEIATIGRTAAERTGQIRRGIGDIIRRNVPRATNAMRQLGPVGEQIAADIEDVAQVVQKGVNNDRLDAAAALRGMTKSQREWAGQLMNGRITIEDIPKGFRDRVQKAADSLREVLDRPMKAFAEAGGRRRVDGAMVEPTGSGKAFPQVLNAEGRKVLNESAADEITPKVLQYAERMVADGTANDIADAVRKMREFREQMLRSGNPYFERTRIELPVDLLEWDANTVVPNLLMRNWMTVAGTQKWGWRKDDASFPFPKLDVMIAALEGRYPDDAARIREFIRAAFGVKHASSKASRDIARNIMEYQFLSKIAISPTTIVRNMVDRWAKGATLAPLSANIRATLKYPPFLNRWMTSARKIQEQMERAGAIYGHGSIAEGVEPGTIIGQLVGTPFTASERGNQVYIALVNRIRLEDDIRRYLVDTGGKNRLGRLLESIGSLSEQSPARVEERLRKAGLLDLSNEELAGILEKQDVMPEELEAVLHRMTRDSAFPVILSTKRVWWDNKPIVRVMSQFKTWPVEQTAFIYREVVKQAARGNVAPMLRFTVATFIAGELYNIIRDWLTGRDEAFVTKITGGQELDTGDIVKTIANDLIDGGYIGMLADLTWGVTDWVLGPTGGTLRDAGESAQDIVQRPELSADALAQFSKSQLPMTRQAAGLIERTREQIEGENRRPMQYHQWRSRAFEFKREAEQETVGDMIRRPILSMIRGVESFSRGRDTLAYAQAARSITAGDIDSATEYLAIVLRDVESDERKDKVTGVRTSMRNWAPFGPIPMKDQDEFLSGFDTEQQSSGRELQDAWIADYERALRDAQIKAWGSLAGSATPPRSGRTRRVPAGSLRR